MTPTAEQEAVKGKERDNGLGEKRIKSRWTADRRKEQLTRPPIVSDEKLAATEQTVLFRLNHFLDGRNPARTPGRTRRKDGGKRKDGAKKYFTQR